MEFIERSFNGLTKAESIALKERLISNANDWDKLAQEKEDLVKWYRDYISGYTDVTSYEKQAILYRDSAKQLRKRINDFGPKD